MEESSKRPRKRSRIEFFDLSLAIVNSILMILMNILIFHKNINLSSIGLLFTFGLLGGTLYTFFKRNPFYIYFFYGLLLNGVLLDLYPLIVQGGFFLNIVSKIILFIIIPGYALGLINIGYFLALTIGHIYGSSNIAGSKYDSALARYNYYGRHYLSPNQMQVLQEINSSSSSRFNTDLERKLEAEKTEEILKENFKFNTVVLISTICTLGFLITTMISAVI